MKLYAWVGEDELGNGIVGLKQYLDHGVPVPFVVIEAHLDRATRLDVVAALQEQANDYGVTIRLVEFIESATTITITPDKADA